MPINRLNSTLTIGATVLVLVSNAEADNTKVCVDVVLRDMDETDLFLPTNADSAPPVKNNLVQKEKAPPVMPKSQESLKPALASEEEEKGDPGNQSPVKTQNAKMGPPSPKTAPPGNESRVTVSQKPQKDLKDLLDKHRSQKRQFTDKTSMVYLKRLIEHFVTHEEGYVAVSNACKETIRIELYPLKHGWTVFARYSGTSREERVDQLFPTELSQFAERAVLALINDVPISDTINRENVLKDDSEKSTQRIKGSNHFVLGLGTQIRGGYFSTTVTDSESADYRGAKEEIRLFFPMTISTGYRGRFENWGIETMARLGIGTSKVAARKNSEGGHIDYGGNAGLQLHFLHYLNPRGLHSFYMGAGTTFELLWFSAIKADEYRSDDSRSTLLSGGLDVDGLFGWEFMRASAVQFFLQGELNLPAYAVKSEDYHGDINTWFPGFSVKLGVVF